MYLFFVHSYVASKMETKKKWKKITMELKSLVDDETEFKFGLRKKQPS